MKNILLLLVGGTICTALNEKGNLSVDEKAGVLLIEEFLKSDSVYANEVRIEPTENLGILSENMTVAKWNRILETYYSAASDGKYDGVVIAHGTDTLAYTAALLSQFLADTRIPVMLVSANENLESERTNGKANFRFAIENICRQIPPNVYVPYRNLSDGKMYLHLASRLQQCANYSEDFFSVGAMDVSDLKEENYPVFFAALDKTYPSSQRKKLLQYSECPALKDCVLKIDPYVGINYAAYRYEKFAAVLHGTYHSGTACSAEGLKALHEKYEYSVQYMLEACAASEKPAEVYLSPSVLRKGTYETVSEIAECEKNGRKIRFLYGYTEEMAYAKLVIAYSLFETEEERHQFIESEYNFERVDSF